MAEPTQRELINSTHELVWIVLLMNILMLCYIGLTEYRVQTAQAEVEKALDEFERAIDW